MENPNTTFTVWLFSKLGELKVDESIFFEYILSIVSSEETRDEKLEILQSVLIDSFPSEDEVKVCCGEILDKWQHELSHSKQNEQQNTMVENLDEKLARLLEANVKIEETAHTCKYTDEDLKIREAILLKYSHADEPDDDDHAEDGASQPDDLVKNMNAVIIHQAEKEKREKAKLESQKKKEHDKLEREKQKLNHQEKKEARRKRAQKVEHHRK